MDLHYFDTLGKAQKVYARLLEPLCQTWQLTRNELDVLMFIANHPELNRAADVVSRRGISKSHVSLAVSQLESKGFLTCRQDEADRRTIRLCPTEKAASIVAEGQSMQLQFYHQINSGVTREELEHFYRITQKFQHNIEILAQE